jgi:hypothetical protein
VHAGEPIPALDEGSGVLPPSREIAGEEDDLRRTELRHDVDPSGSEPLTRWIRQDDVERPLREEGVERDIDVGVDRFDR